MGTIKEAVAYARSLADKAIGVDFDGYYGYQCKDLYDAIMAKFAGVPIMYGNASDIPRLAKERGLTYIEDAWGVNPKAGDLVVFQVATHDYGHVGLVIEDSDGVTIKTVEQNVDGNKDFLVVGGVARYVTRYFNAGGLKVIGWVRPPYDDYKQEKTINAITTKEGTKMPKYINTNLMNTRNLFSHKGVVIHNDAGSMTPEQYVEWLKGRDKNLGIAHYYINRDTIARVVDTYRVAYHTGDGVSSTSGNGNYIGYEVCQSMSASDKDFLANEDMTLMQATEDLLFYGLPINTSTVRLHHEFVPTSCPHRSMALHGGTTASTKAYFIQRMQHFAKLGKTVNEMLKNQSNVSSATPTKKSAKPTGKFKIETINREKGEFAVRLSDINSPDGVKEVLFPVWTTDGGQDDLVWYGGVKQPNGTYLLVTNIGKHKNNTSEYNVHAYIKTPDGVNHLVAGDKFNMTDDIKGNITITNINVEAGTFQVNLKDVKTSNKLSQVLFPTWTTSKGQDDLKWYVGTLHTDGTYSYTVHTKDHGGEFGEYIIHVYGVTTLGARKGIGGTKLDFKEETSVATTPKGKPEVVLVTKEDIDIKHVILTKEEYEKLKGLK